MTFLAACLLFATPQTAIMRHTFATSTDGWAVFQMNGMGAKVSATTDAAHLKVGPGSLKVEYTIEKGNLSAAVLPIAPGALAKMQSLRFWIKADEATPFMISVQEKEGGRFVSGFYAPKGVWQEAEMSLSDFALDHEANAPKDANGKLDVEKIESISFADLGQVLAQNDTAATIMNVEMGARTYYLSDFEISSSHLPDSFISTPAAFRVDTFSRPQSSWLSIGGPKLGVVTSGPVPGKSLRMDYKMPAGRLSGIFKRVPPGSFTGKTIASLQFASLKDTALLVQFEETGGGKYNVILNLPGDSKVHTYDHILASLAPSDDSKDDNKVLDADKIRQLVILDLSSLLGQAAQENTLWIGNVVAKKE
jgi:hypothetical protein